MYIQSSDVDRALTSGQFVAVGLLPPSKYQVFDELIQWQPIPIHTVPWDHLLLQAIPCDKMDRLQTEYFQSKEVISQLKRFRDLGRFLTREGGTEIQTIFDYFKYFDVLFIEYLQGFS